MRVFVVVAIVDLDVISCGALIKEVVVLLSYNVIPSLSSCLG